MLSRSVQFTLAGSGVLLLAVSSAPAAPQRLAIENHQPFRFNQPIRLRNVTLDEAHWRGSQGQPVQNAGNDTVLLVDLSASSTRVLEPIPAQPCNPSPSLTARADGPGLALTYEATPRGHLQWDLVLQPPGQAGKPKREAGITDSEGRLRKRRPDLNEVPPPPDFAALFAPLPLAFEQVSSGPLFSTWSARTTTAGLELTVEADTFHAGFVDLRGRLENRTESTSTGLYCAVVCRWTQPAQVTRALCYDSRFQELAPTSSTTFRAGEGHHLAIQRGTDWIRTRFADNASAVWAHDFAEGFTVFDDRGKKGGRWVGGSQPQLGQEVVTRGRDLYSITEIARSNIKRYRGRFVEHTLMHPGEAAEFESRLVFNERPLSDLRADQIFVAYTCYREQKSQPDGVAFHIGVPHVRFGTSYFPYSTLGENFDYVKLPGMDREGYWPLAADTVNQWELFADDIRRDLCIAKAMGFDVIRLHHLEVLGGVGPEVRQEYLDFLMGEMRRLGLKALLDVQMKPEEVAGLVARYRDVVDGVEVENEVLIFGIRDGREKYWNSVYDAVKAVAPEVPVHLTGHSNSGIFNRLEKLGGKTDRIGFHSYVDAVDAIPSARGMALAVGNYAAKAGKPAAITEWNWRFLTRVPFEERATLYPRIISNALVTRSIPEFHQFQFMSTLGINPRVGRSGIRHYEPIFLSRRPKPEAFELMKLIESYTRPDHPVRRVHTSREVVELDGGGRGTAQVRIGNAGPAPMKLRAQAESWGGLRASIDPEWLELAPGETRTLEVDLATTAPLPGFYHFFVRLEGGDLPLRYAWGEARLAGKPEMSRDLATSATWAFSPEASFPLDLSRPVTVVYGEDAPILDLESALLVQETLESATGRPVGFYELENLPAGTRETENLILIGSPETNALVAEVRDVIPPGASSYIAYAASPGGRNTGWLLVGGAGDQATELAAVELVLSYWRQAKDSAARRIGRLVARTLPRGSDPTKLP